MFKSIEEQCLDHVEASGLYPRMSRDKIQDKFYSCCNDNQPEKYQPLLTIALGKKFLVWQPEFTDPITQVKSRDVFNGDVEPRLVAGCVVACVIQPLMLWKTGTGCGVKYVLEQLAFTAEAGVGGAVECPF